VASTRQAFGAGCARVLDLVGQTDFAAQRHAAVDRPGVPKLGLRKATWLTFRRTYASWSHDQGVPGKVVAKLMGHTNADVTLNIYTQAMDDSLRTAVDRVGNRLFNIVHSDEGSQELSH
jgi:hypothetical protein